MNEKETLKRIMENVKELEPNDYKCFDVIMKDLEVLEILKTKLVNLWYMNILYGCYLLYETKEEKQHLLDMYYNFNRVDKKLSIEELDKIMMWLEN